MEQAVIIQKETPGPVTTIVTEQGVFLYLPQGKGYGVIVPLEGSQGPSRAYSGGESRGSSQGSEGLDKSLSEAESDPDSPEEPESE